MKRKYLNFVLVVMLVSTLISGCSNTTDSKQSELNYPTGPIQVIVGWGAGGGTDVFARAIAKPAGELMGKAVNVVNMSGASGAISGDYIISQAADGYSIWAEGSNYAINVALGKTPHDLSKYIPVARIQHDTASIQVEQNSKFKTIEDLIDYAKNHPGEVTVGGTGAAGFDEVVIAKFEKAAGIDLNYVPFESGGDMRSAVLGGHIDAQFEEFGPAKSLIDAGSIRVLLAFTDQKIELYPNVPLSADKGWDVTDGIWRGIFVKAGTPKEVVDYLRDVFKQAKDATDYKEIEKANLIDLRPGYMDSEEFTSFIDQDINAYKEILRELGYIN